MTSRKEYTDYIDHLYSRYISEDKINGYSRWALVIAIVILLKAFISTLTSNSESVQAIFREIERILGPLYVSLLFSWVIFFPSSSGIRRTKFDYRIYSGSRLSDLPHELLAVLIILLLPAISCYLAYTSINPITAPEKYGLKVTALILFIVSIFSVLMLIYDQVHRAFTGFPTLTMVDSQYKGILQTTLKTIGLCVLLLIGVSAVGSLVSQLAQNVGNREFYIALELSFISVASLILFLTLVRSESKKRHINSLNVLKRDVAIHEISESDIRIRLEEEILGTEFGVWLGKKIGEVSRRAQELAKCIEESSTILEKATILADTKNVDPESVRATQNRLSQYKHKLKKDRNTYVREARKLVGWLTSAKASFKARGDIYLQNLIEETEKQFQAMANELSDKLEKL